MSTVTGGTASLAGAGPWAATVKPALSVPRTGSAPP